MGFFNEHLFFCIEVQSVGLLDFKCNNKRALNAWFIITLQRAVIARRCVLSDFFLFCCLKRNKLRNELKKKAHCVRRVQSFVQILSTSQQHHGNHIPTNLILALRSLNGRAALPFIYCVFHYLYSFSLQVLLEQASRVPPVHRVHRANATPVTAITRSLMADGKDRISSNLIRESKR